MNKFKLLSESLYEFKELNEYIGYGQAGSDDAMSLSEVEKYISTYMPYIINMFGDKIEYQDANKVGGEKMDEFDRWGFAFIFDEELFSYYGLTIMLLDYSGEIKVKFYCDTVAFDGKTSDDEYMDWIEGIPIETMTEKRFKAILAQIQNYLS